MKNSNNTQEYEKARLLERPKTTHYLGDQTQYHLVSLCSLCKLEQITNIWNIKDLSV